MAKKSVPLPEDVEIDEEITFDFESYGDSRQWTCKKRNNVSRKIDTVVAGAMVEAIVGEVIESQQGELKKLLIGYYDETRVTQTELNELWQWITEERERLYRAAVAAKSGRPFGGQSPSGA